MLLDWDWDSVLAVVADKDSARPATHGGARTSPQRCALSRARNNSGSSPKNAAEANLDAAAAASGLAEAQATTTGGDRLPPSPTARAKSPTGGGGGVHFDDANACHTRLVLSDFGEVLDCQKEQMDDFCMQYRYSGLSKGGAPAYLPPEVARAKPGPGVTLNFGGHDAWALGMLMWSLLSPDVEHTAFEGVCDPSR